MAGHFRGIKLSSALLPCTAVQCSGVDREVLPLLQHNQQKSKNLFKQAWYDIRKKEKILGNQITYRPDINALTNPDISRLIQHRHVQTYSGMPFPVNMRHLLSDMPHHEIWDKPKDAWQVPYCPDKKHQEDQNISEVEYTWDKMDTWWCLW